MQINRSCNAHARKMADDRPLYCSLKAGVEKSLGRSVKVFRDYLKGEVIKHECTISKCPEQNGVAERLNRTLVEMVRSMLADSDVPKYSALLTSTNLQNRSPMH